MSNTQVPISLLAPELNEYIEEKKVSTVTQFTHLYANEYAKTKSKIDLSAAKISRRNDKITYIKDIISEITSMIDVKKEELDLSKNSDLLERIRIAKEELKVKLPENILKLNQLEQNNVISNLNRAADNWHKKNQSDMSAVENHQKHLEFIMMVMNTCSKGIHQAKLSSIKAARGA